MHLDFSSHTLKRLALCLGALSITVLIGLYYFFISSPGGFTPGTDVIVETGQGAGSVGRELYENDIIRSLFLFRAFIAASGGEHGVSSGMYVFAHPENLFTVVWRITHQNFGYVATKVTIPEGSNTAEIASIIHDRFPDINEMSFYTMIHPLEGYLFPDTYFFPPLATGQMISDRLHSEFQQVITSEQPDIATSGHTEAEIVTMASILEQEVQTDTDRKLVADILWRRIQNNMPLQVDSTLGYVLGKTSAELTSDDLHVDSPYNSYTHKGLPPTPISNPGKESIEAALHPTPNDYLYFLSDKNGITHFAKTYAEHLKNKALYLR